MLIIPPNAFGDAVTNMAIDAALLGTLPPDTALLRHYAWTEPSATFGYTQAYAAVAALCPPGVRLCRRPTGGGFVDHRNDWTYALVVGRAVPAVDLPAPKIYSLVHAALRDALADSGVAARLAPCPEACGGPSTRCFDRPAGDDVVDPLGTKLAGAAMRRTREGLLLQGSLARECLPDSLDFEGLKARFAGVVAASLELRPGEPDDLRPLFNAEKIAEASERFGDENWLKKR